MIILDEPTNHLDIFAKDILKQALIEYRGTLILVSHDRNFLSGLTDRVIEFSNRKIREYPGDIDSYLDQQEVMLEIPVEKKKRNVVLYKQKKEFDKQLRFLTKQTQNIESEITKIENEIKIFNELLSEVNKIGNIHTQIDYNDYNRLNDLLNIQLENWEKNQIEINKIIKN